MSKLQDASGSAARRGGRERSGCERAGRAARCAAAASTQRHGGPPRHWPCHGRGRRRRRARSEALSAKRPQITRQARARRPRTLPARAAQAGPAGFNIGSPLAVHALAKVRVAAVRLRHGWDGGSRLVAGSGALERVKREARGPGMPVTRGAGRSSLGQCSAAGSQATHTVGARGRRDLALRWPACIPVAAGGATCLRGMPAQPPSLCRSLGAEAAWRRGSTAT